MNPSIWVPLVATVLVGVATIVAIIRGPIMALRIQRQLDEEKEVKNRKLWIFKTLMSFRATQLAPVFVQALNLIDLEFASPSEKPVRDAWKELQDYYVDWSRRKAADGEKFDEKPYVERAQDFLSELLVKMGNSLGYSFDKVYVKKAWYHPEGLEGLEREQNAIRKGVLAVLAGHNKIPVAVFEEKFPPLTPQKEVRPTQPPETKSIAR